jgi:hypothetical protein
LTSNTSKDISRSLGRAAVMSIIIAVSPAAYAQWPVHAPSNLPKGPDGQPNLRAPAPKTRDGHPDLTGLWQAARPRTAGARGADTPAAAATAGSADSPPLATFFDIGANLPKGLPIRDWARKLKEERMADGMKDNPDAHCLPMGYMQFHQHPQPRKIIQTSDVIVILYEANYGVREIYMDGRSLPDRTAQPWWYGYSVGRWDGDTLVVESTGFKDGGWLDVNGSPLTDEARVIEKFKRLDYGALQIDVTIDDQKAYTEPFTVRVNQELALDTSLMEFVCLENERSSEFFDP